MIRHSDIFVRRGEPGDVSLIATHRASAAEESLQYRGAVANNPVRPRSISLIAGVGTTAFGSLLADSDDGKSWTITHVFVEPEAREVGLGDALILQLLETLRSQGATTLVSQAQPGNRALKNLFERHGLVAQTILVGRSLD